MPKVNSMDRTTTRAAKTTSMLNIDNCIVRLAARVVREDDGVTAIEYALLAALIAVTCVIAFQTTGTSLSALYAFWSGAVIAAL